MSEKPTAIYDLPGAENAQFVTFCGGSGGESTDESCVMAARLPGAEDAFILRSNLPGAENAELRATAGELRNFFTGMAEELGLQVTDLRA